MERVQLCLRSLGAQTYQPAHVLVVEMSEAPTPLSQACAQAGASYIRVRPDGAWPLARLTNVAGRWLLGRSSHFTKLDADALLAPHALDGLRKLLMKDPLQVMSLRPRRLPAGDYGSHAWHRLVRMAQDHGDPRTWGMCMTHSFDAFESLRGHDESFDSWGYEDNNYVFRARALGYSASMVDMLPPGVLHQWHLPLKGDANKKKEKQQSLNGTDWGRMHILEEHRAPGQLRRKAW